MILATGKKSLFAGKDVFVPSFLHKTLKERNKINNYTGRYTEREYGPMDILFPMGLLLGMSSSIFISMAMNNAIVLVLFFSTFLAFLLGGVVSMLVSSKWPKKPYAPIIRQDNIHWSMLLVAFGDDQALWNRLTHILKNGRYMGDIGLQTEMSYVTPLMRELDDAVSAFMTSAAPTIADAMLVRTNVKHIFDKYDQLELEKQAALEAANEFTGMGAKQLFDCKVQMAYADVNRDTMTVELPYRAPA